MRSGCTWVISASSHCHGRTRSALRLPLLLTLVSGALVLNACKAKTPCSDWINEVGSRLDAVELGVERFGTISASSPLLVPVSPDKFRFALEKQTPDTYFESARTPQAARADLSQRAAETGIGAQVRADLAGMAAHSASLQGYMQDLAAYEARRRARENAVRLKAAAIIDRAREGTDAERAAAELEAQEYLAQHLPGPDTRPEMPSGASATIPSPESGLIPTPTEAKSALLTTSFHEMGKLLATESGPALSDGAAIAIAAANTANEAIYSLLGSPAEAEKFKGKRIMLGVCMVSVRPGSITSRGYAADLSVEVAYGWQPARKEWFELYKEDVRLRPIQGSKAQEAQASSGAGRGWGDYIPSDQNLRGRAPLVAAVSPMIDADVLDLGSSLREQRAFALRIAAVLQYAGLKGDAGIFTQFAKRLETDLASQHASAAITSYNHSGGVFGFQIGPRFRAIGDPTAKRPQAEMILERQSFPVLLIIGIDESDLVPVPGRHSGDKSGPEEYLEPRIQFRQSMRWLPINSAAGVRVSETERLAWAAKLREADRLLETTCSGQVDSYIKAYGEGRSKLLWYQALGSSNYQDVPIDLVPGSKGSEPPPPKVPTPARVIPDEVGRDGESIREVWIAGSHLDKVIANAVTVHPSGAARFESATQVHNGLLVRFVPSESASVVCFSLPFTLGNQQHSVLSPPVSIKGVKPAREEKVRVINRSTTEGSSGPGTKTIHETIQFGEAEDPEVVKEFLRKDRPVAPPKDHPEPKAPREATPAPR